MPYFAGTRAEVEEVVSKYRFRPTRFAGYFLEVRSCTPGDVVLRHVDPLLGPGWALFSNPTRVLEARSLSEVSAVLQEASAFADDGGFSAGLLTYEAGPAFDSAIKVKPPTWPILAWFGVYEAPPLFYRELAPVYEPVDVRLTEPDMPKDVYRSAFGRVREALASGESYQVNLTFRQPFSTLASAADFFVSRCGVSPPPFAAFVHGGDWQVASFSPELLFERDGLDVTTKPMKGTARASVDQVERRTEAAKLARDPKSRAENIMIVDMARNDLGAVCEVGSVKTPRLLQVERQRGLLQMTSTVTGRTSTSTLNLVRHMFPAASITGAPKVATTHLIAELENSPRHIYCGSIGVMAAGWQRFSVAIRTALFREDAAEFGVGGGIVWDSEVDAEFEECLVKREFLLNPGEQWALVEALSSRRVEQEGYVERHLNRLDRSANELGITYDRRALAAEIRLAARADLPKVRVALRRDGSFEVSSGQSWLPAGPISATVAMEPVASADTNFRFKTNSRATFSDHLDAQPDADEVLLYNERGELTEFCRGNLVAEIEGQWYTPPFDAGCLPGLFVSELIAAGKVAVRKLTLADLAVTKQLFLTNSVVGMVEIQLRLPTGDARTLTS